MDEATWLTCTNPEPMLTFLREKTSARKLRLFACACCRHVWHLLSDKRSRKAVEIGEQMADGLWKGSPFYGPSWNAYRKGGGEGELLAAHGTTYDSAWDAAERALVSGIARPDIIRDIFGNPFCSAHIESACLSWNAGTVSKISHVIYEERAFDLLPILADALEDAGCTCADTLAHCRQEGLHSRGCWVVDRLLGHE